MHVYVHYAHIQMYIYCQTSADPTVDTEQRQTPPAKTVINKHRRSAHSTIEQKHKKHDKQHNTV